jgi:cellulose synthase/poly-beta-1,6-N-acetylglucosamine synthase-like glycosyltransferase
MRRRHFRWTSFIVIGILLVGLASIDDAGLAASWWAALSCLLTPSIVSILEASWSATPAQSNQGIPRAHSLSVSIVVSAYLPNEQSILVETVRHVVQTVKEGDEVIVVYNTSTPLPIEKELQALATACPRVRILPAHASKSKAENLNLAVARAKGDVIAFFDADSRMTHHALPRALARLAAGGDFCQGANAIALRGTGWIERLVAVEFLEKFFVSYQGRWKMAEVTYFCGSNAYSLRRSLDSNFSPACMVEDIEYSVRAALSGTAFVFDPNVIAEESAPPSCSAWWQQRMRWAIGWRQVVGLYKWRIWPSRLPTMQKILWTFFLHWRRVVLPFALVGFVAISGIVALRATAPVSLAQGWTMLLLASWLAAMVQAVAALPALSLARGIRRRDMVVYTALFPFYDLLRSSTMVLASFISEAGRSVTPRDTSDQLKVERPHEEPAVSQNRLVRK